MKINNPLISIIIPTYGGPDYLPRAIRGVLSQSYTNWEVIIVDDNGLDTNMQKITQKAIKPFLSDPRIHYISHIVNKNASAARNTGVVNSSGEYIALLDDDDEYCCCFLEKQVKMLSSLSEDYAFVYCSHVTFYNEKQIEEYHALRSGNLLYENLIHDIEIATSSILIRRCAFESVKGFDESFQRHQDWEFIARISAKYMIKANDFIGYKRFLEWRNVPNTVIKAKEFREHYLDKMMPFITKFSPKRQKEIILSNKLDIAIWYLKDRNVKLFIKEYKDLHPGWYGLKFFCRRLLILLSRGKVRLV